MAEDAPSDRGAPLRGKLPAAVALAVALAAPAGAAPPKTLDADVAALIADGPPGMAVAIVEDGRTVLAKGYGVKVVGGADMVAATTLFEIGSTTKAFTSAALAILVDEGVLDWDDRVVDHMPEFEMHDPWVTREMRVKDLLTHRSGLGLGAGDLTIVPRTIHSRAEITAALRHLKPKTSFRTTYAYSNLMYVVAGHLIERVSGRSWETCVQTRLLDPAGMSATFPSGPDRLSSERGADRARPHARLGPPMRGMGPISVLDERRGLGANMSPAGGIASSVEDMARWIALQLGRGVAADGTRIWSAAQADAMWTIVTPLPAPTPAGRLADSMPRFAGYGLGWRIRDYHGDRIVTHAGGTMGFSAQLVLMPERNVGFVIMQNSEEGEAAQALMYRLLDHYTGRPPADWAARFREERDEQLKAGQKALEARAVPERVIPMTLSPAAYAGAYRDAWYGPVAITYRDGALRIDFTRTPGMVATLTHQSGDSFLARWEDAAIEPALVAFHVGDDGKVSNATLAAWSPVADFSFDYHDLDLRPEPPSADLQGSPGS
jgi:CubicO group peptidase (beta-lactamase class C family)